MAEGRIKNTELAAIAAAIRAKNGESAIYKPSEMAQAILDIPTGGTPVIESKSIAENGTYTAPSGVDGYSPITVDVPNSYSAGDEGKVVSNGALVAQGSDTVTENGTIDTTLISSLVVNVSGGGGGFQPETAIVADLSTGYVSGGLWTNEPQTPNCYSDVYEITAQHYYVIRLGAIVGNRLRCMFSLQNTATATGNISGSQIGTDNNSPSAYQYVDKIFVPTADGYLTIGKDNAGTSGIETFVYDITGIMR